MVLSHGKEIIDTTSLDPFIKELFYFRVEEGKQRIHKMKIKCKIPVELFDSDGNLIGAFISKKRAINWMIKQGIPSSIVKNKPGKRFYAKDKKYKQYNGYYYLLSNKENQ